MTLITLIDRRLVVNLDADLYSSTLFVLTMLASRLKRGDLLMLDEAGAVTNEFRALIDFTSAYRTRLGVVAATRDLGMIALEVL
jgi:hypothetical protein